MTLSYTSRGIAYLCIEWLFNVCELSIVSLRLYSRTFLTRSVGSDDFAIVIGMVLDVTAAIPDLEAFLNGWAEHEDRLSVGQYSSEQKWEYISIILGYLSFFFIRASVLLFVLRLLPAYKKRHQRVIYAVFFVNFAITLAACVMFGISCIPLKGAWDDIPDAKCFSKKQLVIVNQVNAILACFCDITTALVPQFLLWNLQIQRKTKRQLNVLFSLGLITAALSIGRAATTTEKSLSEDSTWREIPTYYFFDFEAQLGVIFACGPAVRQFYSYCRRTHSCLPSKDRQYPNEDFESMRRRVNIRDIIWFRQAPMRNNRAFDAAPIFRKFSAPPPDPEHTSRSDVHVKRSRLDIWEQRIRQLISFGGLSRSRTIRPAEDCHGSSLEDLANKAASDDGARSSQAYPSAAQGDSQRVDHNLSTFTSLEDPDLGAQSITQDLSSPSLDYTLVGELADPRSKATQVLLRE